MRFSTFVARCRKTRRSESLGFTLIELLISLSIIVLLMALILPAVQSSRHAARKIECQNHIKNLSLAVLNYATLQKQFPTLHSQFNVDRGNGPELEWYPWPVTMLPYVDQNGLAENWEISPQPDLALKVFTCPSDRENWQKPGGLSYVINCGYGIYTPCCGPCTSNDSGTTYVHNSNGAGATVANLSTTYVSDEVTIAKMAGITVVSGTPLPNFAWDWDKDGKLTLDDHLISRATGVTWNPVGEIMMQNSIDDITRGDGGSHTLLLAENDRARRWGEVSALWINGASGPEVSIELSTLQGRFMAAAMHKGFGISTQMFRDTNNEHVYPGTGYQTVIPPEGPLGFASLGSGDGLHGRCAQNPRLNHTRSMINTGGAFDPNSKHPGGANVVFCDGHVQFLTDEMNVDVYARMVSSDGVRLGQVIDGSGNP